MSKPVFNGTPEQQELADEVFSIMRLQGTFFAATAPIKQTLKNLATFFSEKQNTESCVMEKAIDLALCENYQIFKREEQEDDIIYITSRIGVYEPVQEDVSHSFKQRLYEPEQPLPITDISVVVSTTRPVLTSIEPAFISDYWQEQAEFATISYRDERQESSQPYSPDTFDILSIGHPAIKGNIVDHQDVFQDMEERVSFLPEEEETWTESLIVQEDCQDLSEEEPLLDSIEESASTFGVPSDEQQLVEQEMSYDEVLHDQLPDLISDMIMETSYPDITDEQTDVVDDDQMIEETYLPLPDDDVEQEQPSVLLEEEEFAEEPREDTIIKLHDGMSVNLALPTSTLLKRYSSSLRNCLVEQLDRDPLRRIVHFGRSFYPESSVVSLGKNDLRRIRDYIIEVGEPLIDTAIIADLYYNNPRYSDYEGFRFSLNYRLSREKDFEFVGVEGARLWSTKELSIIGTKRVKINEMGQMTSYLSEFDDSLELQSIDSIKKTGCVDRLLTFFEWEYGILPLDQGLSTLLPEPMLLDQRSAVLRFESPQHFTNFLVEVRYPTGSRGGWIQGLEDFFHEHLVAGALVSISRTEEPNIFTIAYQEVPVMAERILTLDEKKNKFFFSDMSYYCAIDEDQLLNQKRFGRLKNLKSLPMNERRKADVVMKHVFETMGDRLGTSQEPIYRLSMDVLHLSFNVLRPASQSYLCSLLDEEQDYRLDEFSPNSYTYHPEPQPVKDVSEEEDVVNDYIVGGRRWTYGDDDD
jgi:hypothetical protein